MLCLNILSRVWHIKTYAYMSYLLLLFQAGAKKERLPYVYPCVLLINQVFVIFSFAI